MLRTVALSCSLVTFFFALALALPAQDIVRLKRGGLMEGLIVEEQEDSLVLQIAGGTIAIRRDLVAEIVRSERPEDDQRRSALRALTRFQETITHHFLYRGGQRVGYRTRLVKPDVSGEVPGYLIEDRMAFVEASGQVPTVDLLKSEFVDADLRPVSYVLKTQSGSDARHIEGRFDESGLLHIKDKDQRGTRHRMALVPPGVALPGALGLDLAREGGFEGKEHAALVFDPAEEQFEPVRVEREQAPRVHRGEERLVRVLRVHSSAGVLETWADRDGALLREEILTPGLVSLRAPASEVQAWARGDDPNAGAEELGLHLVFEGAGCEMHRPDPGWEVQDGDLSQSRVVTLSRVGMQATMDLLRLPVREGTKRAEEVALKLASRMGEASKDSLIQEIAPIEIAGRGGVRFVMEATRKDVLIQTVCYVFGEGERFFALIGAAPKDRFASAINDFDKAAQTLRLLRLDVTAPSPFERVESETSELEGR